MTIATATDGQASWYALWTRGWHEHVVHDELKRREVEVFLPTIAKWSRWKDRRKRIDWPLFPGYCFARFDLAYALTVRRCTGVVNIVSVDGRPAPIADREIENIQRVVEHNEFDPCPMLREGTVVEVVHGPLAGIVGRVLRKEAKRVAVVVAVEVIGQGMRVHVDASDLRAR